MDEDDDSDEESAWRVLARESSQLAAVISSESPSTIVKLCRMAPHAEPLALGGPSAAGQLIKATLEYFERAEPAQCRNFIHSVCMMCENMPMDLEARLLSAAGEASEDSKSWRSSTVEEDSAPPPSQEQLIKRPRIDHWQSYITAAMSSLRSRWERHRERLLTEVQLENVWVSPRSVSRGRDRPDQTPGSADQLGRTPESDGVFGVSEPRVTLESFLHGCAGKTSVLCGAAGSGKTLLMSCLGEQWARGLGPIPCSSLLVLLEFHQLNMLSCSLSLTELLFKHYLPPNTGSDAERDIVDYLVSNPEQICWVLDGYDQFQGKITKVAAAELMDAEKTCLPVADLISGLLNRRLLPGCTLLVTCRGRDVADLSGLSDKVGQLLGWNCQQIRAQVDAFFSLKADKNLLKPAAELLLSSRHLLSMSTFPALCNICCICAQHLLQQSKEAADREEDIKEVKGGDLPGGHEDKVMDGGNGRAQHPTTPPTLTQTYLALLSALLSHWPDPGGLVHTDVTGESAVLSRFRSEVCELSALAWRGLENNKIIFLQDDLAPDVLGFAVSKELLSQVELRRADGAPLKAFRFAHLTLQEFMAALHIMTSNHVSDAQIKKRFSLKTRWTTRSEQRSVFTDSLHLYVCGLASPRCAPALLQLAHGAQSQALVRQRQTLILKMLKNLCDGKTRTGPKVLELCQCVQESQELQLARGLLAAGTTLELRNIWLTLNDIEALAFVAKAAGDNGLGLDFGACSMEPECLELLPRCRFVHTLSFRGRRYVDKFAEKLSTVLPEFGMLRRLEFCGTSLTAEGAASLATALQKCPNISEINLSDNCLKDEGITHIYGLLPELDSVRLGQNYSSLKTLNFLIKQMASRSNIKNIHADDMDELTVTFLRSADVTDHQRSSAPSLSLLNQKWNRTQMQKLTKSLAECGALSVLDLSGGQWDENILGILARSLPTLRIHQQIILNDCCSSVEGLLTLLSLLSDCAAVTELSVRLQSPQQASILFSGTASADALLKTLRISHCLLLPANLHKIWRSLGDSVCLTKLDLSWNQLGNNGLRKLLGHLNHRHHLSSGIQEVDLSYNDISMEGAVMLAEALCSQNDLTEICVSKQGREQVILRFCPDESIGRQQLKIFRMKECSILPDVLSAVCRKLLLCRYPLELDLSHSPLTEEAIAQLLKLLPRMTTLHMLNLNHSVVSVSGALLLLGCLTERWRGASVELRPQGESFIRFAGEESGEGSCRLTNFHLSGDDLEKLLKILLQSKPLSDLYLPQNQLEDGGIKRVVDSLLKLRVSRYVNLNENGLTVQGMLGAAATLCACLRISCVEFSLGAEQRFTIWFRRCEGGQKTLSVRETSLNREHLERLAAIVSHCPSLSKVELQNNSLRAEHIQDFVGLLSSRQTECTVSVEESWIRSSRAVNLLCHCLERNTSIHEIRVTLSMLHLSLSGSAQLTSSSSDCAAAAPQTSTRKISLVNCNVLGSHIAALRGVILENRSSLTELDFSHNSLGVEGAEFLYSVLPSLPNLTSLSIGFKEIRLEVAEKLSEALLRAANLQRFSLTGHVIGDAAAPILAQVLPRLKSVRFSHCGWSAATGLHLVKALGQCDGLEALCLDTVHLDEESVKNLREVLRSAGSLRSLRLSKLSSAAATAAAAAERSSEVDFLPALQGLTHMTQIELDDLRLADSGVEHLTKLLPMWTQLKKISLSKNSISDGEGAILLEALRSCDQLEELDLARNQLGDVSAAQMALVLPSLTCLSVLDISENQLGPEGLAALSGAVGCMKNLSKINLTSVGSRELCALAASLSHCPLIQDVRLGWNRCGDEVALELARVAPQCQSLTRIDLEMNAVGVRGAEALLRALQISPALELIRLWKNSISSSDAESLSLRDRRLSFSST